MYEGQVKRRTIEANIETTVEQRQCGNAADLQAGEYRLLIDGNRATVQKGKSVVAESQGRWEDRDAKSNYDSVLLGENGQVREVRFSGQKRVFVFSE